MSYYYETNAPSASQVFRIFSYVNQYASKGDDESCFADYLERGGTTYSDLAEKSALDEKNKSGMTKMLEDYKEKCSSRHGESRSNITAKDCKRGFFGKILAFFGLGNDNIFETKEAQKELEAEGKAYQSTLYTQEIAKNDGVVYCKKGDDIVESALNFAKAEITAIENVCEANKKTGEYTKGKLTTKEADSYTECDSFEKVNIAGDEKTITAEEYASYIIAADTNQDGRISGDEAQVVANTASEEMQEKALEQYNKYFNK